MIIFIATIISCFLTLYVCYEDKIKNAIKKIKSLYETEKLINEYKKIGSLPLVKMNI